MAISLDGTTGIQTPNTQLVGSTSGVVTLTGAATAGTWSFTMPTTPGTAGYVLGTDGLGGTSWVPQTGGTGISVSDEGSLLTSAVTSFDFTGAGVTASAVGNAVTVSIPGGSGGGTYTRLTFTATAGQTSFTASYTVGYVQVYVNGILLNSADYTATTGTTVVLASAAAAGDIVDVIALNIGTFTSGGYTRTTYTASAGQTSFTAAYTPNYVQVYANGVLLDPTDYTASSGTAIVLGTAATAGDTVDIVALNIGGFTGGVTVTGTPTSGQLAAWTGSSSIQGIAAPTTTGNVLFTTDGTSWSSTQKIVQGTSVSASGTSVTFTGIPAWVKRITVMCSSLSTNGTSNILLRVGPSGGVDTTGYLSATSVNAGLGGTDSTNFTTGFSFTQNGGVAAAAAFQYTFILSLVTGNTWMCMGVGARSDAAATYQASGRIVSSGTLSRVAITMANGTDTFDAGSVNILYE